MAKIKVEFDHRSLTKNIKGLDEKINRRIGMTMQYESAYAVGWLKQNAPWTDDTAAARTGLTAIALSGGNTHELIMAYSVYYGIWLEVANSGRYAVITPGMRIIGEKVMADMQGLIYGIIKDSLR